MVHRQFLYFIRFTTDEPSNNKAYEFLEAMKQKLELWLSVIGYEGLYEVSNFGRVRSLEYKGKKRKEPLIIGGYDNGGGYLKVCLRKDRKNNFLYIHRLVCESFILGRKMKNTEFCDHINTIRDDNRLENLRVVTRSQNALNPITRMRNSLAQTGNKNAAKSLTLRGVKDGSVYHFKSSTDASRFFNYKMTNEVTHRISRARKDNKRTIKLNGEEFYFTFEQKGEIA